MNVASGAAEPDRQALFAQQLGVLGERVRAARRFRGWSQRELGARCRVDRGKISMIEAGKSNITLGMLWRMAAAFEVHWVDLLDGRAAGPPDEPYTPVPFDQQLAIFGLRVYQARKLQRLTQPALAQGAGVSRPVVTHVERGTENVKLETLSGLAAGLDVSWGDLLDDRQPDPPRPAVHPTTVPTTRAALSPVRFGIPLRHAKRHFDLTDTEEL